MALLAELVGLRFGRLKVVCIAPPHVAPSGRTHPRLKVRCDCGGEKIVHRDSLVAGDTLSCGCLHRETGAKRGRANRTHGEGAPHHRSPEYKAWGSMKDRCYREGNIRYAEYGGRGIRVCKRWLNSFEDFLRDMGRRPSPDHSMDRIDNDGNYEPGNCRWATRSEQRQNRRTPTKYKKRK